ncbi:uncharacterized protein V6R79_015500 [Siganus canaliculatus]
MFPSAMLVVAVWGLFGSVSASPAVEEAYQAVVDVVSPGESHLTEESLRTLFNTLENRVQCSEVPCGKCNLTDAVHQLIGNHSHEEEDAHAENVTVSVSDFSHFAAGCVLYLSAPELVCNATTYGGWGDETDGFLHTVTHVGHVHEETKSEHEHNHDYINVDGLKVVFDELRDHYEPLNGSCVSASEIMSEVNATAPDQNLEVGAVLGRVLYYALQGRCFVKKALPGESFFPDYIMTHLGSANFTVADLESLMTLLSIGPQTEDEHDHDHEHASLMQSMRSSRDNLTAENTTWDQICVSAEDLLQIYDLEESSASGLGASGLTRVSPALIQQILSGACQTVTETATSDNLSVAERYIYATLANVVITLMAMFGIVLLLCTRCTNAFQAAVQFCVSLAVGSLTGDALLHLLPMFLGLHVHEAGADHSHDHEGESDYIYKMLVVIAGIYLFYLIETIFGLISHKNNQHNHQHHDGEDSEPHNCDHGRVLEMYQQDRKRKTASKVDLVDENDQSPAEMSEYTREQRLLPYMITLSDGIHNFADGLAMGGAFALSWRSGLATSLAVFCHELPHELGDFAILLHSGMSVRKALLFNVGSAMTSFIGLYIALSVATDLASKQWIAAVASGLFLYVGLADMLPTMVHIRNKRPWLIFGLQNLGLLIGWIIMLLLSLYEEKIVI